MECYEEKDDGFGCVVKNITSDFEDISTLYNFTQENSEVKWINLKNCALEEVTVKSFWKYVSLKKITIDDCTGNVFLMEPNFVNKMIYINITGTDIKVIKYSILGSLSSVKSLYLNSNKIMFVGKQSFLSMKDVETIELADNAIESLQDETFKRNTKLKSLNLSGNKIKIITYELLVNNIELKDIQMQDNSINYIEKDFFTIFTNINTMDFSNNMCINQFIKMTGRTFYLEIYFKNCYINYEYKLLSDYFMRNITELKTDTNMLKVSVENVKTEVLNISKQTKDEFKKELKDFSSKTSEQIAERVEFKSNVFNGMNEHTIKEIQSKMYELESSKRQHNAIVYSLLTLIVFLGIFGSMKVYKMVNSNNNPHVRYFEGDIHLL